MPIKNNDDVAHFLQAAGRPGSPYREFEAQSDQISAPLIDAVFAKAPPESADEMDHPVPLQGGPAGSDLVSEVFDAPPPRLQPPAGAPPPMSHPSQAAAPGQEPAWAAPPGAVQPAGPFAPYAGLPPGRPASTGKRSLGDIRRIITRRVETVRGDPQSSGLNGLFDRLAR
jgi:hypothetical protein